LIQRKIGDALATKLLSGEVPDGSRVLFSVKGEGAEELDLRVEKANP
jgi:ATP-dependent Clp protease ATP-binding subunit ClpA